MLPLCPAHSLTPHLTQSKIQRAVCHLGSPGWTCLPLRISWYSFDKRSTLLPQGLCIWCFPLPETFFPQIFAWFTSHSDFRSAQAWAYQTTFLIVFCKVAQTFHIPVLYSTSVSFWHLSPLYIFSIICLHSLEYKFYEGRDLPVFFSVHYFYYLAYIRHWKMFVQSVNKWTQTRCLRAKE